MTPRDRFMVLTLVALVMLLPLAVLHPLFLHLGHEGESEFRRGLLSPGFLALLGLATAGVLPLAGFVAAVRTTRRARHLTARLLATGELRTVAGVSYYRVPDEALAIMTVGFWRPAIVVTTRAEAMLTDDELHAALLHEQAHQRRRDLLWRTLLAAGTRTFHRFPRVRALVAAGVLRSECIADDEALRNGANRKALFEAMVLAANTAPRAIGANLAEGTVEYRLLRLARSDASLPTAPAGGLSVLLAGGAALPFAGHLVLIIGLVCRS